MDDKLTISHADMAVTNMLCHLELEEIQPSPPPRSFSWKSSKSFGENGRWLSDCKMSYNGIQYHDVVQYSMFYCCCCSASPRLFATPACSLAVCLQLDLPAT